MMNKIGILTNVVLIAMSMLTINSLPQQGLPVGPQPGTGALPGRPVGFLGPDDPGSVGTVGTSGVAGTIPGISAPQSLPAAAAPPPDPFLDKWKAENPGKDVPLAPNQIASLQAQGLPVPPSSQEQSPPPSTSNEQQQNQPPPPTSTGTSSTRTSTPTNTPTKPSEELGSDQPDSSLTAGAIVGIVLGSLVAVALCFALVFYKRKNNKQLDTPPLYEDSEQSSPVFYGRLADENAANQGATTPHTRTSPQASQDFFGTSGSAADVGDSGDITEAKRVSPQQADDLPGAHRFGQSGRPDIAARGQVSPFDFATGLAGGLAVGAGVAGLAASKSKSEKQNYEDEEDAPLASMQKVNNLPSDSAQSTMSFPPPPVQSPSPDEQLQAAANKALPESPHRIDSPEQAISSEAQVPLIMDKRTQSEQKKDSMILSGADASEALAAMALAEQSTSQNSDEMLRRDVSPNMSKSASLHSSYINVPISDLINDDESVTDATIADHSEERDEYDQDSIPDFQHLDESILPDVGSTKSPQQTLKVKQQSVNPHASMIENEGILAGLPAFMNKSQQEQVDQAYDNAELGAPSNKKLKTADAPTPPETPEPLLKDIEFLNRLRGNMKTSPTSPPIEETKSAE